MRINPVVRRLASPPSRPTDHKSPAYEKTMCVLFIVGVRISSGVSWAQTKDVALRINKTIRVSFFISTPIEK